MTKDQPKPDIFADIELYLTAEGGMNQPISGIYNCPTKIGDIENYFDCRMYLVDRVILPGAKEKRVPIKFLSSEIVKPLLKKGARFHLWDGRFIGEAVVDEIISDEIIKFGCLGKITEANKLEHLNHFVKIEDDQINTGGFLIFTSCTLNILDGWFDNWFEDYDSLTKHIKRLNWKIEWIE